MRAPPLYDRCSPREADLEIAVDPPRMPTWHAWVEIAALAALVTAARLIFGLGLPWMALAPLRAGVRYGSCFGVACAVQVAMVSAAAHWYGALDAPTRQPSSGGCSRASSPGSSATRGGAGFTSSRPVPATRPSASMRWRGHPDAVAHAALALLGDPARWRAAQQAAIRRVETHYTEARVFDAYRRIYQEAHTWHA